ncbi:MAG: hypothetical protein DIZ80_04945 [endosymbiont of Galathealinum brachiosum]|uniref:DUF3240 domain-containing protein n=1 Tax=endosymbiont of Galathealinum brachiosum TaxID=2200906 RepID=A0A370DKA1_9GAMM|nr:MAG: hypothetical protein DIZ80_04945 [endosymbiont of Galathealinum brachiosum]
MKKLSMVVHESLQQTLADYLRSQKLDTFMFNHIEEHSSNLEKDSFLSARDKVVGYVPQVRLDIILSKDEIKSLLDNIRKSDCAFKGKGIYWITDIDEFGVL